MINSLKLIFSNFRYIVFAIGIFSSMVFTLLLISEYIFLEPYFVSHIPNGTELGFLLIVILSIMSSIVIPMNVYRITVLKRSTKKISGSVFGSFVGSAAGACSCGPIGFAIISTFGTIGATASAFLTNFEIPIRITAIIILCITYYTTIRSINVECRLKN